MKKTFLKIMICLLCFAFTGCGEKANIPIEKSEIIEISDTNLKSKKIFSYNAFVDDSLVYSKIKDGKTDYYRYYIKEDKTVFLGTINNVIVGNDVTLIGDNLYFYIGVSKGENDSNLLVNIDLKNNTLKTYESGDESSLGIPTTQFFGDVITIKNNKSENTFTTYFETFDVKSGKIQRWNINEIDKSKNSGTLIYCPYGNGEAMFALQDEHFSNGDIHTSLKEYNENMQEVRSIEISKDICEKVIDGGVKQLAVWGKYVYFTNLSNHSVLGEIVNNTIEPILMEDISMSHLNADVEKPFFFIRGSNVCYEFDTSSGDLSKIQLNIGGQAKISFAHFDEDSIWLECYYIPDDIPRANQYVYYIPKTKLNECLLCAD